MKGLAIAELHSTTLRIKPTSSGKNNGWLIIPVSGLFPDIEYLYSRFSSINLFSQKIWSIPWGFTAQTLTILFVVSISVLVEFTLGSYIISSFLFLFCWPLLVDTYWYLRIIFPLLSSLFLPYHQTFFSSCLVMITIKVINLNP